MAKTKSDESKNLERNELKDKSTLKKVNTDTQKESHEGKKSKSLVSGKTKTNSDKKLKTELVGSVVSDAKQNKKYEGKQDSKSKKKTIVFRTLLISLIVLVVAGISVGMYFLFKTPANEPNYSEPNAPGTQDFSSDINNGNISSPDISDEVVSLPSEVDLTKVSYIDESHFVVSDAGVDKIYKRVSSEPGYELIENFSYGANHVSYSKVLDIVSGFAFVSSSDETISYLVKLDLLNVVLDTSGLNSFMFKNGLAICYNENINNSGFYALKVVNLETGFVVLNFEESDKVYDSRIMENSLYIYTEEFEYVYLYKVVAGTLKLGFTEARNQGITLLPNDYVEGEDEVLITYNNQKYKIEKVDSVIYVNDYYKLVETRVPVKDYLLANYVNTLEADEENVYEIYYSVSYKIVDLSDNFVKTIDSPGVLSFVHGRNQIDGYVSLDVDIFAEFDENGEDLAYRGKDSVNAIVFDSSFNLLFAYNRRYYGDVIYSFDDYFVTSYGSDSGIIDKNGAITGIIDTELYEIKTSNVWNNKFIVKFNSRFGVSDNFGNVVLSPKFLELSPIVDGVTIGYYVGNYYYINLNNDSLKKLENYDVNFHKFTMLGVGMYMLDENGKHNIYLMNGELAYEDVKDYSVVIEQNDLTTFKMFITIGDRIELVSSNIIDKHFYKNNYSNYVAKVNENTIDVLSNVESLVFDTLKSFNAPEIETPDEPEIIEPIEPIQSTNPSSDSSEDGFDAVGTYSTDLSYLDKEYYNTSGYISSNFGHSNRWWKKDTFSEHVGEIGSIHEDYSYTDEFAKNIVLTPYILSEKLYPNKGLGYKNGTLFEGVLDRSTEYQELWGDGGLGFGYKVIDDEFYYDEGRPLEMFGEPNVLKTMIPSYDSNGRITQWWGTAYGKIDPYVDGVLIYALPNKHMVIVVTRIHIVTNDLKYPGHGAFKYDSNELSGYIAGTSHKASIYTYNVSIGFVDGYSVDELYIGNYLYRLPYDNKSATTYGYEWYDEKQYRVYEPSSVDAGRLAPVAYFVPDIQNSTVQEGLLIGTAELGWKKDLKRVSDYGTYEIWDYKATDSSVSGVTWHCRFFNEFQPITVHIQPGSGQELETMKYWDIKQALYGDVDNRFNANYNYIDSTSLVRLSIKFSTSKERDNNVGIYADNYKKNISVGTSRTINGHYYSVNVESDGTVTITPKTGFYIASCEMIKFDSENENKPETVTLTGLPGSNGEVKNITAKVTAYSHKNFVGNIKPTYIHISSISVCPIIYELSNIGKTYYWNEEVSILGGALNEIVFTPYAGNYKAEDAYKIAGNPISDYYKGTYYVDTFYYGVVNSDAPTVSEKLSINSLMTKLDESYYGYEFAATINRKDSNDKDISISQYYSEDGFVDREKVSEYYFKYDSFEYDYYYVNFEMLETLFNDTSSTNVSIQTYSLYDAIPFAVKFSKEMYDEDGGAIQNAEAKAIKVADADGNYNYFTFDDDETTGIGNSFFDNWFYVYPDASMSMILNNFAKKYLSNNSVAGNSPLYKFWSDLSVTAQLPILIGSSYEMNNEYPTYRYVYGEDDYDYTSIYFASSTLKIPENDFGIFYGVFEAKTFDVVFSGAKYSDTGEIVSYGSLGYVPFNYDEYPFPLLNPDVCPSLNRLDYRFSFPSYQDKDIGETINLPSVYLAEYQAASSNRVNPALMTRIFDIQSVLLEDGTIVDYEGLESIALGQTFSLDALDSNFDGVVNIKVIFSAEETQFAYIANIVDTSGTALLSTDYISEMGYSIDDGEFSNVAIQASESELGSLLAGTGVKLTIRFKLVNPNFVISNIHIVHQTRMVRPIECKSFVLGKPGYNNTNVFCKRTIDISTNVDPYFDSLTTAVSGTKTRYDLDDDYSINLNFNTKLPGNNGTSEDLTEDEINNNYVFELKSDGYYYLTFNTTQLGYFASRKGIHIGAGITLTIGSRELHGDVGIETFSASNINKTWVYDTSKFNLMTNLILSNKKFLVS